MTDQPVPIATSVLRPEQVTVGDLFDDLARGETAAVQARLHELPTDVMLLEGAGALIDGAASLRFVATRLFAPGGDQAVHMLWLAEELTAQAARFQHAGDTAALARIGTSRLSPDS